MRVQPLKRAVPVPSTDLRAALAAIQTNAAGLHMRLNDDSLTEHRRMELEARIAANGSLRNHIARLCKPASDTVHEETLQKVREELRGGMRRTVHDDEDDGAASDDSSVWDDIDGEEGFTSDDDDDEEEEEVDESDLVDQNTLRKVRELRETVRTISNRVHDKMADVTERAVQLAGREVEGMRNLGGKLAGGEEEGTDGETAAGATADPFSDDGVELSAINAARIATMQSTLTSLSESVAKIETAPADEEGSGAGGVPLPMAVSDLQSTVDTVAAALAKAQLRREEGDEAILSQTERAILSKPEREGAAGAGDADDDIRAAEARAQIAGMNPEERFAVFMSSANGTGGCGSTAM